jgi:hypothetical protein
VSLTQAEHVFAGAHEAGINDLLRAFFTARGHYLNYGTSSFVAATTASATNIAPIPFPGVPGGIEYAISFSIPKLDCFPDSSGGASPLPIVRGQFTLHTRVRLTVGCAQWSVDDRDYNQDRKPRVTRTPISTVLDIWARCQPTVTYYGPGIGEIGIQVDAVEIVDIKPDSLESVLECVIRMMLQGALSGVKLPFKPLTMGAFSLILLRGPLVEDDQIKLYGDV